MPTTTLDVERETIRTALLAIVEHNHGVLNPQQIVDTARDPKHVLHGHFEWDDHVASEAYRLAQAGALIRRVRLTIVRTDKASRTVTLSTTRGYQSRPSMRTADGGYEPIDAILADQDKRAERLAHVLNKLSAYRRRYAELSELEPVWIVVDELTAEHSPSLPPD